MDRDSGRDGNGSSRSDPLSSMHLRQRRSITKPGVASCRSVAKADATLGVGIPRLYPERVASSRAGALSRTQSVPGISLWRVSPG